MKNGKDTREKAFRGSFVFLFWAILQSVFDLVWRRFYHVNRRRPIAFLKLLLNSCRSANRMIDSGCPPRRQGNPQQRNHRHQRIHRQTQDNRSMDFNSEQHSLHQCARRQGPGQVDTYTSPRRERVIAHTTQKQCFSRAPPLLIPEFIVPGLIPWTWSHKSDARQQCRSSITKKRGKLRTRLPVQRKIVNHISQA